MQIRSKVVPSQQCHGDVVLEIIEHKRNVGAGRVESRYVDTNCMAVRQSIALYVYADEFGSLCRAQSEKKKVFDVKQDSSFYFLGCIHLPS